MIIAPDDGDLHYSGCAHLDLSASSASCDRLIRDSPFHVDNPSMRIAFRTAAKSVAVVLEYAAKADLPVGHHAYNSSGVGLVDGAKRAVFTRQSDSGGRQTVDLTPPSPGQHTYEVLMPVADKVDFCGVELEEGAHLGPVEEDPGPRYVPYGDSITQGFWASSPARTYPYLVARNNGWDLVNMGFGSRAATASDGEAVARLDPDLVTVLIGVNDCLGGRSVTEYEDSVRGFVSHLRQTETTVPTYLITPLNVPGPWAGTEDLDSYREAIRAFVRASDDTHLHLIEGPDLIPDERQYFQDGLHPNDAGFALMAQRLGEKLSIR